jgi:hypothetical protein
MEMMQGGRSEAMEKMKAMVVDVVQLPQSSALFHHNQPAYAVHVAASP